MLRGPRHRRPAPAQYDAENDFAPLAYANLVNLKAGATRLFERLKRP